MDSAKRPRLENKPGSSTLPNDGTPKIVVTKCGHMFHEKCIKDVLQVKKVCPTCQGDLHKPKLIRLKMNLIPGPCSLCMPKEYKCIECRRWDEELARVKENRRNLEEQLAKITEDRRNLEGQLACVRENRRNLETEIVLITEYNQKLDEELACLKEMRIALEKITKMV